MAPCIYLYACAYLSIVCRCNESTLSTAACMLAPLYGFCLLPNEQTYTLSSTSGYRLHPRTFIEALWMLYVSPLHPRKESIHTCKYIVVSCVNGKSPSFFIWSLVTFCANVLLYGFCLPNCDKLNLPAASGLCTCTLIWPDYTKGLNISLHTGVRIEMHCLSWVLLAATCSRTLTLTGSRCPRMWCWMGRLR